MLTGILLHHPVEVEQGETSTIQQHLRGKIQEIFGGDTVFKISFSYQNKNIKGAVILVFPAEKINSLLKQLFVISNG